MVGTVSLDPLPLKRVLALEEAGTELLPPEQSPEEKSRSLLQRIDFEESDRKDTKKAKPSKEQLTAKWPWQGLVENLQLAHQELVIILDFLTHIEANDAITVASITKPKQLPSETELALRAASKLHNFKKVGKYLKQTAKALEQQVDREAIFYGALMRLQQHWKVKRLRMISAGPGGNAGFTIDLSYPQMAADVLLGLFARTAGLYTVNVAQDSSGLLTVDLPGHQLNALRMHLCVHSDPLGASANTSLKDEPLLLANNGATHVQDNTSIRGKGQSIREKDVGEAVNKGALAAHSVLRKIQTAILDEMIFESTVRECLQPPSGLVIAGIEENSLQISLGHLHSLTLELLKIEGGKRQSEGMSMQDTEPEVEVDEGGMEGRASVFDEATTHESPVPNGARVGLPKDKNAIVFLQQAFYRSAFVHPQYSEPAVSTSKSGPTKTADGASSNKARESGAAFWRDSVEVVGPLKHFSLTMRHRVFSSKVLSELEKLVSAVPHVFLSLHPTWHSRVTSWDLTLEIPQLVRHGWEMRLASWRSVKQKSVLKHRLKVVVSDASIAVEAVDLLRISEAVSSRELKMSRQRCELSELPGYLLYKFAGQLVKWLHDEAMIMGLKVRRDLLSLFLHVSSHDEFVIVASIDRDAYCINWSLQLVSLKAEAELKEDESCYKGHAAKFLGPLGLECLRGVLVDFLNSSTDDDDLSWDHQVR